jgi:hypothetical protein
MTTVKRVVLNLPGGLGIHIFCNDLTERKQALNGSLRM